MVLYSFQSIFYNHQCRYSVWHEANLQGMHIVKQQRSHALCTFSPSSYWFVFLAAGQGGPRLEQLYQRVVDMAGVAYSVVREEETWICLSRDQLRDPGNPHMSLGPLVCEGGS